MHNIAFDISTVADSFQETIKGLHEDKRSVVVSLKTEIESQYKSYLHNIKPCTLERLSPLWPQNASKTYDGSMKNTIKETIGGLYESKKALRSSHWNALSRANDDNLMCPLCGFNRCRVIDHYAPRERFAEFSIFRPNLIPLCDDCNNLKSAEWLDKNNRLFFNAFFDVLPPYDLFQCEIQIVKGYPWASITISNELQENASRENRIITTIEKLHLISRMQEQCNILLRKEIQRLLIDSYCDYDTFDDFWESRCRSYSAYCTNKQIWNVLECLIFSAIINSTEFTTWLRNEVKIDRADK